MPDIIKESYDNNNVISQFLKDSERITDANYVAESFRKTLLLSCASNYEFRITRAIIDYVMKASNKDPKINAIIYKKAINRQYHTYFNWTEENKNANTFFDLFGGEFKEQAKKLVVAERLEYAVEDFLALGRARNELVHNDFIQYTLSLTAEEIYAKHINASRFVDFVERLLS